MIQANYMETLMTRIPVRSRRQAMDWSLVLASQGIDTAITEADEVGNLGLLVASRDAEKALKTLRQYRLENRDWPWRQTLLWPQTHFDWGSMAWAGALILVHSFGVVHGRFREVGIMDTAAVISGQWWRVFTAILLHADVAHLVANLTIGIVLLGLAMGRYGTGTGLLGAYLAGVAGNLASLFFNTKPFYGLGASGMVMGSLGLLAAQSLPPGGHKHKSMRHFLTGVAAGSMLFILYGLTPGTDLAAHFGGFAAGLVIGVVLAHAPRWFAQSLKVNLASGCVLMALVTVTWWLAIKT